MLRFNGESPELVSALKEALDTMLSVLAYLNDSMHQVAIIGYEVRAKNIFFKVCVVDSLWKIQNITSLA